MQHFVLWLQFDIFSMETFIVGSCLDCRFSVAKFLLSLVMGSEKGSFVDKSLSPIGQKGGVRLKVRFRLPLIIESPLVFLAIRFRFTGGELLGK